MPDSLNQKNESIIVILPRKTVIGVKLIKK